MKRKQHFHIHRPVAAMLRRGGVGVIPTDTIYGIVGSALRPKTVELIYKLRRRDRRKPMIVLIARTGDIRQFGVALDQRTKKVLAKVWPGKVSIILPAKKFRYLHRGTGSIAFRLPKPQWLRELLLKAGPLVAPSANREGEPPARTVAEAKKYFGDKAWFYVDKGRFASKPSTVIKIEEGKPVVLRS
jgi:L-threonylcarbamoyladenylate synthase